MGPWAAHVLTLRERTGAIAMHLASALMWQTCREVSLWGRCVLVGSCAIVGDASWCGS